MSESPETLRCYAAIFEKPRGLGLTIKEFGTSILERLLAETRSNGQPDK